MKSHSFPSPEASSKSRSAASRRRFLKTSGALALGFQVVPSHVLGLRGATPPSGRLRIAGVGVGGQGRADLEALSGETIVALCDVDWAHAAGTFRRYPKAKPFKDYRKMIDEMGDGIDAVMVATPDHSHAPASSYALAAGKPVYCEKPLTHDVWEAQQLEALAQRTGLPTQMGNQGQASEETRRLIEMVQDGAIGPVREVHIWTDRPARGLDAVYWPQGVDRPGGSPKVPDTLDWDLWIGPAPWRPYHPAYAPFRWRGWWDFGTGALGDIGCHVFDPVFRALDLKYPESVHASSTLVNRETYPLASMATYDFPAREGKPPVRLTWYDGGLKPPRPKELENGRPMPNTGHLLIGDSGKIMSLSDRGGRGYRLIPESRQREYGDPPRRLSRSPGHHKEWILACKGEGPHPGSHFAWAGPLTETVLMGNIALRPELREQVNEEKLLWDSEQRRFKNSETANGFLKRDYRDGWNFYGLV